MSAPVREPDNGPSEDGPLNYAPKKVRHESDANLGAAAEGGVELSGAAPESAEPPWKRSRRREAADAAIAVRRNKLALTPDRLPGPPHSGSIGPKYVLAGRLAGVVVVTAFGVVGYQLGSSGPTSSLLLALRPGLSDQEGLASELPAQAVHADNGGLKSRSAAGGVSTEMSAGYARGKSGSVANAAPVAYPPQSVEPTLASPAAAIAIVPQSIEQKPRDAASSQAVSRRLTVGAVPRQQADEAAKLAVAAGDAGANASVVIGGLVPGSAFSAGTQEGPNVWRLSVSDLAAAAITPPRGFIGTMDLTVELHLADDTVADRKGLQVEWSGKYVPAKSQPRQHEASEIALMMKSGADLMANGDVAGARLMYQRAAEAGEALAAFALAETYDPLVLRKLNAKGGIAPDIALAHRWYEKARDLGSATAPERLERLARLLE